MTGRDYFYSDQHVEISRASEDDYCHTVVTGVLPQTIHLFVPFYRGKNFPADDGAPVKGRFVRDEALYSFVTTVAGRTWSEADPVLVLNRPSHLIKNQRRDYYRYPVILDMEYAPGDRGGEDGDWTAAYTLDVGGGGIRFVTGKRLREKTVLQVRVYLPGSKDETPKVVEAAGTVLRAFPPRAKGDKFVYSLQFNQIRETQRDRIIGFIFAAIRSRVR
jgi:c-di-GMP-binding flagellar brake protein YcgR